MTSCIQYIMLLCYIAVNAILVLSPYLQKSYPNSFDIQPLKGR